MWPTPNSDLIFSMHDFGILNRGLVCYIVPSSGTLITMVKQRAPVFSERCFLTEKTSSNIWEETRYLYLPL